MTRTKQQLLSATVLQPERCWYLLELAAHLGRQPSSIQRDLRKLVDAGILTRQENGNRVYFQSDQNCPVFPELQQLLQKTAGLVDVVRQALDAFQGRLKVAFIYGSLAASEEHSISDVDLFVVGTMGLSEIAWALRDLNAQLGRNVNPLVYSPKEFRVKAAAGNHFLSGVLGKEKLFVNGSEDDLAKLAHLPAHQASPRESSRDSRSTRRSGEGSKGLTR